MRNISGFFEPSCCPGRFPHPPTLHSGAIEEGTVELGVLQNKDVHEFGVLQSGAVRHLPNGDLSVYKKKKKKTGTHVPLSSTSASDKRTLYPK